MALRAVRAAEAGDNAIAADHAGRVVDTAVIGPGDRARLGSAAVSVGGFSSYVTFLSRRDPGVLVLFVGAGLLVASLAVAFWRSETYESPALPLSYSANDFVLRSTRGLAIEHAPRIPTVDYSGNSVSTALEESIIGALQ